MKPGRNAISLFVTPPPKPRGIFHRQRNKTWPSRPPGPEPGIGCIGVFRGVRVGQGHAAAIAKKPQDTDIQVAIAQKIFQTHADLGRIDDDFGTAPIEEGIYESTVAALNAAPMKMPGWIKKQGGVANKLEQWTSMKRIQKTANILVPRVVNVRAGVRYGEIETAP